MGGIKTPIEIESNLSWNRLVRQSFQAIPVPESWDAQWKFQIPPVSYPANGFIYLIGVGSESAPPTWRLGCSVRLASGAVPDSTGEFSSAAGLPLRIDDRRPCTLGSYTLLTWPDMNLVDPHLIVEFPHWLQDATIEIFWYDGKTTGDFFSKLRESLVEIFGDTAYLDENLGQYMAAKTREVIQGHEGSEDPHIRYLQKYEAAQQYLRIADLDEAIADSDALRIALNNYILKSEAAAFVSVETFNQERTFVDASIEEIKAIAAADLAAHEGASNPHGITPGMIGAVTQQEIDAALASHLAAIDPHPQYLTQDRGDIFYAPKVATENAIASHLTAINPHGITPDAIGAAAASHSHIGTQITGNIFGSAWNITGIAAISNGGTGASNASRALINLGAAAINHLHNIAQISDVAIGTNSISLGKNFKIGWGISDNQWLDYGSQNTIYKDIDTRSAGFSKIPIYVSSLYGNSSHWIVTGATSIYVPTATGFRIYATVPDDSRSYIVSASFAAQYDWRIAWLGIQAN